MPIPCHFDTNHLMFITYITLLKNPLFITHTPPTHAYSFPPCHHIIVQSNTGQTPKNKKNTNLERILAQLLAQAEGPCPGERDSRSGEFPLPRRELENLEQWPLHVLA